ISYSSGYTTHGAGFTPGASAANYIYGPSAASGTHLVGIYTTSVSPNINTAFSNYLIPSAGSSAVLTDQADAALLPNSDIRNVTRTGALKDIGCYEVGLAGNSNHPLLRNEVGPAFDGGPAGTAY
ncbi:MAG TPA: hypothetical protein VHN79_05435, partial [Lacunisphaera sp.]|nr:hypothetical protein [Lacunisphaera sp.]